MADLLRLPSFVDELAARFAAAGHRLYLVGGSVRDELLGRLGTDLDFATDARPERIAEVVAGWAQATWMTGAAFGTVGVERDGHRLEITTFRSESYRAESRKPDVAFGDSIEGDLYRRDFTVNALAVSLPDRQVLDPFGGLRDLASRVLRTPAPAPESFGDDPLRILRAARFAAQLGFTVTDDVRVAMAEMRERLRIVSAERVREELSKLVCAPKPVTGLRLLVDTGVADVVLPELPRMRLETDAQHRHKDVYEHSLTVLENAIAREPAGPDLTLRLAALLHDIGKPDTRGLQPGGVVTFHHHEVVGAVLARRRLTELRFPKGLVEDVARLIELHLRFHGYADGGWSDSAVRRYVRDAGPLLDRLHILVRSDCTTRNERKARALDAAYTALEERIGELASQEELQRIRPDLDGNEVMAVLGVPPGRVVGEALAYLLELRMERGPLGRDAALAALRSWAESRGIEPK